MGISNSKEKIKRKEVKRTIKETKQLSYQQINCAYKAIHTENWNDAKVHLAVCYNSLEYIESLKLSSVFNPSQEEIEKIKKHIGQSKKSVNRMMKIVLDQIKDEDTEPVQSLPPKILPKFNYSKYNKEQKTLIKQALESFIIPNPNIQWNEIIGCEEAIQEFRMLTDSHFDKFISPLYKAGNIRRPKGVLLFGPPGTGKTLLAQAVVTACKDKVAFFQMNSSSIRSKYVGETEKILKGMFDYANQCAPSMVLIDEADQIFGKRRNDSSEHSKSLVGTLLQLMSESKDVFFVATTNRPFDFDTPFRRRFENMIYVGLPTVEERVEIINHYLKNVDHWIIQEDIKSLANATNNYSPAELSSLISYAARLCINESKHSKYGILKEGKYICPTSEKDKGAMPMHHLMAIKTEDMEFKPFPMRMHHITAAMSKVQGKVDLTEVNELEKFRDTFAPKFIQTFAQYD